MQTITSVLQDANLSPLEKARLYLRELTQEQRDGLLLAKKYQCEFCEDKRYVAGEFPQGHNLFGKLFPCPRCNTKKREGITDAFGLYASDYFLSWKSILEVGQDRTLLKEIKDYLQECQRRGWGFIYLWGQHGNGKSEIGRVAAVMSARANLATNFLSMFDLFSLLYSGEGEGDTQARGRANFDERLRTVGDAQTLILDEFDKVYEDKKGNNWITAFQVLNRRYENAMRGQYGLTLLISNEEPEHMLKSPAGEALYSRLQDERAKIFHLTGDSLRPLALKLEALK